MWKIEKTVKKGDYLYAVVKDHPRSSKYGYVLYHRIIMENHIGRILNPNEVVHHIDGNKLNNNIENLQLQIVENTINYILLVVVESLLYLNAHSVDVCLIVDLIALSTLKKQKHHFVQENVVGYLIDEYNFMD